MKEQVRMIDVARRAQVGIGTVSRVLNDPSSVSEDTRRRVTKAIEESGYVPNLVAGSLAARRTNVIAAIVPTIGNPVFSETIEAMNDCFRQEGFHLLLGQSGENQEEAHALIRTFLARRPDGLFIHGGPHAPATQRLLQRAGIPIVESGDLARAANPIDMVVAYSNFAAARAMTEHLLAKGYRRLAFVGRELAINDRAQERMKGFRAALDAAGVAFHEELVLDRTLGFREGAEALLELRRRDPGLDCVFFGGDIWAAGALYECQRQGWGVPGDIGIAGFDDHAIAEQTVPALTTVRVKRGEIGRRAAEMILSRIKDIPENSNIVDVGFQIVMRLST